MTNAFFTNLSYVRMEEWRIFVVQECMKTPAKMAKYHIFWKFLAKKYCCGNKWQSTTFSRTWVAETQVPHQFCHYGTAELEFMWLKKIMWYSSLVNSSTMQHSTRELCNFFFLFFFFSLENNEQFYLMQKIVLLSELFYIQLIRTFLQIQIIRGIYL